MSESYAVSEKRELLLDKVKKFILDNGGIVKKSQLAGLGIDYRRILDFVEKGDILLFPRGHSGSSATSSARPMPGYPGEARARQ